MTRVRSTARVAACTRYPRVGGHLGSAWPSLFKPKNSKNTVFFNLIVHRFGLYNPLIGLHRFLYPPWFLPQIQHLNSRNIPFPMFMTQHCRFNGLHIYIDNSRITLGLYSWFPVQAFRISYAVTRLTSFLSLLPIGDYSCAAQLIIRASPSVKGLDSRLDTLGETTMTTINTSSVLLPEAWTSIKGLDGRPGMTSEKTPATGKSLSAFLQAVFFGFASHASTRNITTGNAITAFWFFQKLSAMLVCFELFFSRTMLEWISTDVLVMGFVILLLWARFQMARYCHIFARHGYLRVLWNSIEAAGRCRVINLIT